MCPLGIIPGARVFLNVCGRFLRSSSRWPWPWLAGLIFLGSLGPALDDLLPLTLWTKPPHLAHRGKAGRRRKP